MNKTVKIVVAVHKPYDVLRDETYIPVHAGALGKADLGYQSDAQGEHISEKNGFYCELTALYWAWKNQPGDALGLMHYRRYLGVPARCRGKRALRERIATGEELAAYLDKTPIILPKKRDYFIENREDQYVHAHGRESLDMLRRVLEDRCPQYMPALERTLKRTSGHCFNIFVMRRDLADAYCQWMFDTLFEVEARMREEMPDAVVPRLFGFLSERMMDCWLETHGYDYMELPVVNMEKQNWPQKIAGFLKRKFAGAKA